VRSILFSALLLLASTPVLADNPGQQDDAEQQAKQHDASNAAESGNFLPFSASPSTSSSYATMTGGYDSAHGGALVITNLQARLHKRFYLQVSGTYQGPGDNTLEPSVLGQLIVLDEKTQGLDLAIIGGWEHQGFNQEPDVMGRLAIGKHVGGAYLIGTTAMGFAYGDNERYGELTLGGLGKVAPNLYAGLDARGRMDLQHDTDPSTEEAWTAQAGPAATYVAGPVGITAVAGVSALRMHQQADDKVGALTMLGVGAVF